MAGSEAHSPEGASIQAQPPTTEAVSAPVLGALSNHSTAEAQPQDPALPNNAPITKPEPIEGHEVAGSVATVGCGGRLADVSDANGEKKSRPIGRPVGSKNKRKGIEKGKQPSFIASSRPRRETTAPERWVDVDPGEQLLRRPKPPPPPNPADGDIREAPTFWPTLEQFKDPVRYIESIRPIVEGYGIAKIVPPDGWNPPQTNVVYHAHKPIPTKKQALHNLMKFDEVYDEGRWYKILDYMKMADSFSTKWAAQAPKREARHAAQNALACGLPTGEGRASAVPSGGDPVPATPVPLGMKDAYPTSDRDTSQLVNKAAQCVGEQTKVEEENSSPAATGVARGGAQPGSEAEAGCRKGAAGGLYRHAMMVGSKSKEIPNPKPLDLKQLERDYWDIVDRGSEECVVEYANDLDVSSFWSGFPLPPKGYMEGACFDRDAPVDLNNPDYYSTCGWNLNNLPFWPGSVLRFFRTHINGLTAPWLYLGMQFSTFAWHNEDNYLYSINYHHTGAPKQWYGVPGRESLDFERCLAKVLGKNLAEEPEILYHITKMLSPMRLKKEKVSVCRLLQEPGQYVVTFPKAYHGGFSYGFNCGEAVNFAIPDWVMYSRESSEAYRRAKRNAALSHEKMVATLAMYLPDHSIQGCELVVKELQSIQHEELKNRGKLMARGIEDPGQKLPSFKLGIIDKEAEDYDDRRTCKVCSHRLFLSGVACKCSNTDVSCLRCAELMCDCPLPDRFLLLWWSREDIEHMVRTAQSYLGKLRCGTATEDDRARFSITINPFERG